MEKIIATIGLVLFIWWGYPHIKNGEWFAPNPIPQEFWGLAQAPEFNNYPWPKEGYGVYKYDIWNEPTGNGRSVTKDDFRFNR